VDPDDPAVTETIANWNKTPGTVGIRIMFTKESGLDLDNPGLGRILRAAVPTNSRSKSFAGTTWTRVPR
jgi:hypothetical protein